VYERVRPQEKKISILAVLLTQWSSPTHGVMRRRADRGTHCPVYFARACMAVLIENLRHQGGFVRLGRERWFTSRLSGADATAWAWDLVSGEGSEQRTRVVQVSGTVMASDAMHFRLDHAMQTRGQSEVRRVLEWRQPPEYVVFHSTSKTPKSWAGIPGPSHRNP
jgi:hypothetical protein